MCLIALSYNVHPHHPLVIIANRDEFYDRPTALAHFWEDEPTILAGRDLRQCGSWIGIAKNGRFAAITNFRDPKLPETGQRSRGEIVPQFLTSTKSIDQFIHTLREKKGLYGGYNALLYDGQKLHHYNNILNEHTIVEKGFHSLSNATINTDWPKAKRAKEALEIALKNENIEAKHLISLLANEEIAPDEVLPNTGVGIHLERALSAQFVKLPHYGTRCSTAIIVRKKGQFNFLERTYEEGQSPMDQEFTIEVNY